MVEHWVFGYGSLMWNPGFPHLEASPAMLQGAHRGLCLRSPVHRGTRASPGLAFGLDVGGSCRGVAYRLAPERARHIVRELTKREQTSMTYRAAMRSANLLDGSDRTVRALCFLVKRDQRLYAGGLPFARMVWVARSAAGRSGRCADYVIATFEHLEEAGIEDPVLARIVHTISPCRLPRPPDFTRRGAGRQRSYGMLKPVPRPGTRRR